MTSARHLSDQELSESAASYTPKHIREDLEEIYIPEIHGTKHKSELQVIKILYRSISDRTLLRTPAFARSEYVN
ncbi:hypothetical protein CHS0354_034463 [Potamilus streckersoni]|uniref:Uncharacterized protein n=1 Tax=Potamilus streckersoni TaxID=2493646 RepID=A0AAE0TAV9_9BIVA|nr:hypothetical protein CHS0354_034463 [Potamilus streckersoni]